MLAASAGEHGRLGLREQRRKVTRMAKDLNKVMIIGRLGKDPEMRYTTGGSPVTTFSVAAGRQWKDGNGDTREETEWFNVVAWGNLAEICKQYLAKGQQVYVEGRLQTRRCPIEGLVPGRRSQAAVVADHRLGEPRETVLHRGVLLSVGSS